MVENEKKIPIPTGNILRQFVIKIAVNLCIIQKNEDILERTLYFLTREVSMIYVVASEVFGACEVRKYAAFKRNTAGSHTRAPKDICNRPSEIVSKPLSIDPSLKLTTIQSSSVLTALRECKSLSEITEIREKVPNIKIISNDKIKQTKAFDPKGKFLWRVRTKRVE